MPELDMQIVEKVCEAMAEGLSKTAACGENGISVTQLARWEQQDPTVDEMLALAAHRRQAYLERGMLSTDYKMPQIAARMFALKNANPRDWNDRPAAVVAGLDQNIVVVTGVPETKALPQEKVIEHKPDNPVSWRSEPRASPELHEQAAEGGSGLRAEGLHGPVPPETSEV
jgi:hypothetical protein